MVQDRKVKILLANPGLDVHDAGVRYVAQILRNASIEAIYLGIRQTAEGIVSAAIQEDVDIIGLSILSGRHNTVVPRIAELLREKGAQDIQLVVGGIIPLDEIDMLKRCGVREVFLPGTSSEVIVDRIKNLVKD